MQVVKHPLQEYAKGHLRCFRDIARDFLVPASPEETVRQNVVLSLINKYGFPKELISTELYVGRRSDKVGRADIVVTRQQLSLASEADVLLLIECKAPSVPITYETLQQSAKYAKKLTPKFVVLTNGDCSEVYEYSEGNFRQIQDIPDFAECQTLDDFELNYVDPVTFERPSFDDLEDVETLLSTYDYIQMAEDTPDELVAPVASFWSLLLCSEQLFLQPVEFNGYVLVEDWGVRYHSFDNAGGGSWPGWYRSFLVRDPVGGEHLVRLMVTFSQTTVKDEHWGTRNGKTCLIVAISDLEFTHNSLQLSIDDCWYLDEDEFLIRMYHNGALSGKGSYRRSEVRNFVWQRADYLLDQDVPEHVFLGAFPTDHLVEWRDVEDVVARICVYALLRDEFRAVKKAEGSQK